MIFAYSIASVSKQDEGRLEAAKSEHTSMHGVLACGTAVSRSLCGNQCAGAEVTSN
jgi:hypothetical protein